MRVTKEDVEMIQGILETLAERFPFLEKIKGYVRFFVSALKQNDRTVLARVKIRLADELDKLQSKENITNEDEIRIKTLEEVIKIIKEEEAKRDISDIFNW